ETARAFGSASPPVDSAATPRCGLAYRSKPNPSGIVARMIADEKKYGDETPTESKAHPKNNGAIILAAPPYVCCIPIYKPRSVSGITCDSNAVTHGNVNAVPRGINATASASVHRLLANGMPRTPPASNTSPRRERFASPSQSTARPRSNTRVKTEIDPTYMKKYPIVCSVT